MPEENQTCLLCLNYCSSSFRVLTLALSQNSRFCSNFLLEREINDNRGGCLWHSSTCLQILYKNLLPRTRQKPASWRQLLRRGPGMASHQRSAQQDPMRFSKHHLPHPYSPRKPLSGSWVFLGCLDRGTIQAASVAPRGLSQSPHCWAQHQISRVCLW